MFITPRSTPSLLIVSVLSDLFAMLLSRLPLASPSHPFCSHTPNFFIEYGVLALRSNLILKRPARRGPVNRKVCDRDVTKLSRPSVSWSVSSRLSSGLPKVTIRRLRVLKFRPMTVVRVLPFLMTGMEERAKHDQPKDPQTRQVLQYRSIP